MQLANRALSYSHLIHGPFGMVLEGRIWNVESEYRYGFNGKEQDAETYGEGNIYDYGFRIYNPRLGKFLSVDPLAKSFPMLSTYQFASNSPIIAIDLDGLESVVVTIRPVPGAEHLLFEMYRWKDRRSR